MDGEFGLMALLPSLAVTAFFIRSIVETFKKMGKIKDGDAHKWSIGLNFGLYMLLLFAGWFGVDNYVMQFYEWLNLHTVHIMAVIGFASFVAAQPVVTLALHKLTNWWSALGKQG